MERAAESHPGFEVGDAGIRAFAESRSTLRTGRDDSILHVVLETASEATSALGGGILHRIAGIRHSTAESDPHAFSEASAELAASARR